MFEERMKTGGREREERRKRGIPGRWEEVRRKTVVVRGCTEAVQPGEATGDNDGGGERVGAGVGAEVGAATGAGVGVGVGAGSPPVAREWCMVATPTGFLFWLVTIRS